MRAPYRRLSRQSGHAFHRMHNEQNNQSRARLRPTPVRSGAVKSVVGAPNRRLGSRARSVRACDENELQAGPVRSISEVANNEPGGAERFHDFGALTEAEGRVGR
jgi:hypothetical protein